MHKRTTIYSAISLTLGGFSMSAQAFHAPTFLHFDTGTPFVSGCLVGALVNGACTQESAYTFIDIDNTLTDMGGSYFKMDQGNGNPDKISMSQFAPLSFTGSSGSAAFSQPSSGQHAGTIDGSESPAIDNPWNFFEQTGMHTNTSPIIDLTGYGSVRSISMSGWGINFADYGPGGSSGPTISLAGTATLVCSTASCSSTSTYTLDMDDVHVPVAFSSVPYSLHLEGTINNFIPVPAAGWLFGSGLAGLASITRRKRHKK